MIAVADTSPLSYLVLIDEIGLLPTLFDEVHIPEAVAAELSDPRAPEVVRRWRAAPPRWLRLTESFLESEEAGLQQLHRGERQAILLARRIEAASLLLDDKAARRAAKALGLPVMGTLALLAAGAEREHLRLADAVERLRRTNFRISTALLRDLLDGTRTGSAS